MNIKYYLLILFSVIAVYASAQVAAGSRASEKSNSAMMDVTKSLEANEPDAVVAQNYVKLAKELVSKGDQPKAEEYFAKAKALYVKLNDKENIALVDREIAKTLEAQNRIPEAISNYSAAGRVSSNSMQQSINMNDANRLKKKSDPQAQAKFIQNNIELLSTTDEVEEKVIAYRQMADVNMKMDDKKGAISNLNSALQLATVKDKPAEAIKINREIANVYAVTSDVDKAVKINEEILAEAKKTKDTKVEIEQLQTLSNAYFDANDTQKGLASLQEAYTLAVERGHTLDAKNSLELLVEQYKKEKNPQKALEIYADFMAKLEPLIKGDSSLIDEQFFQVQIEKIAQLEKERTLKDELIEKKNTFNYALIASVGLMLILLLFIVRTLFSIKRKNKEIALQSLRREMNPHFIFNSLNSVNQFIAQNNELEANKYLSSYSKLMRNMMENSNKDFIPLTTELDQLKEYLELEYMRFHDKFTYTIEIADTIDPDSTLVPNMLVQPQLENAIWHGLRYREGCGTLLLKVEDQDGKVCIVIEDDGIGIAKSKELKTKHQRAHQSRGLTNTYERIKLLNDLYKRKISITIEDKSGAETGVIVTICFPLMHKNK